MIVNCGNSPSGDKVKKIYIKKGILEATILTYGATLQKLRIRNFDQSLILGYQNYKDYFFDKNYLGCTVGRFSNRIKDAQFKLGNKTFHLNKNDLNKHTLHGGNLGSGAQNWEIFDYGKNFVCLSLFLPDGHMGFPGNLNVYQYITIQKKGILDVRFFATTDQATPCSFSNHYYFNLDASETTEEHFLKIKSKYFLGIDKDLIPTKKIKIKKKRKFNFQKFKKINNTINLDHNFCLSSKKKNIRTVAFLKSKRSGIKMKLETTEVGLQVYNGSNLSGHYELTNGQSLIPYSGIALEPQYWPDSPNRNFPSSSILIPGSTYEQHTKFSFYL